MNLTAYVTPVELVNAPSGLDWNAVPFRGANAQQQAAEQTAICWRVTARTDELAGQVLRATVDQEELRGPDFRLTVDNSTGEGVFLCSRWPVLGVVSAQWADSSVYPPNWTAIPANQLQIDGPLLGTLGSLAAGAAGAGPFRVTLAPGIVTWWAGRRGVRVQLTYINGWPNAGISASTDAPDGPAIAATSIHVDDITGWTGVTGWIYDGQFTEAISVLSIAPDTAGAIQGPGTLALAAGLLYAHAPGVRVSAMPASLQKAQIDLASAHVLTRGATAIGAQALRGQLTSTGAKVDDLEQRAEKTILRYARVW